MEETFDKESNRDNQNIMKMASVWASKEKWTLTKPVGLTSRFIFKRPRGCKAH